MQRTIVLWQTVAGWPNAGASPIASILLKAPAGACRPSGPKLEHEGAIILLMVRVAPAAHCNVRVCSLIWGFFTSSTLSPFVICPALGIFHQ